MSDGATTPRRWEQNVETGKVLLARGDHARAADAFAAAARAAEHEFGANSLQLGACLSALGQLALQRRDHAGAADHFSRALSIRERALGPEHADVVQSINGLAAAQIAASNFDAAEPLLRRALAITERLRGISHPDVGPQLNNLAKLHFKRGELAQAEPLLTRLLVIKRAAGPAGAEVATVLASLATVKQNVGDHMGAEALWREAIALREQASSPTDSALAPLLENLADCCAARQKRADAIDLRQRALGIREGALGADHPSVAAARARLIALRDGSTSAPRSGEASPARQLSPISVAPVASPPPAEPVMRSNSSAAEDTIWWTPNLDAGSAPTPSLPVPTPRAATPVTTSPPIDASWEPRAAATSAPPPLEVMSTLPPPSPFEPPSPPLLSDVLAPAPPRVTTPAPPPPPATPTRAPTPPPASPLWAPAPSPPRPRPAPVVERRPSPTPDEDPPPVRVRRAPRPGWGKRLVKRTLTVAVLAGGAYAYTQRALFMPTLEAMAPAITALTPRPEATPDSAAVDSAPVVAPLPDGRPNVPTGPAVAPLPRNSSWRFSRAPSTDRQGTPTPIARVRPVNLDGVTKAIDLKTRRRVEEATGVTLKAPVFAPAAAPAPAPPR